MLTVIGASILKIFMVKEEHIVSHADKIWKAMSTFVVDEARVDGGTDQIGDLGAHSSLHIQLGDWKWWAAGFSDRQSLELTSV